MAYKPLSQHVAEVQARNKGGAAAADTHHIENPREHDIHRLMDKEEEKPAPPNLSGAAHELRQSRETPHSKPDLRELAHELRNSGPHAPVKHDLGPIAARLSADRPSKPDYSAGRPALARMLEAQNNAPRTIKKLPNSRSIIKQIQASTRPYR